MNTSVLIISSAFAPGDRVVLDPEHIARVGNQEDQGDFGYRAVGTVVEVRWRGEGQATLVVEWDGGSCRNHHPRSLLNLHVFTGATRKVGKPFNLG